jgi:hypothetical protein
MAVLHTLPYTEPNCPQAIVADVDILLTLVTLLEGLTHSCTGLLWRGMC